MGQRLAGKTAIVTGAGQGIGKGIALYLAGEGADIAVAEYNEETAAATAAEVEQSGRRALACPLDISDAGSVSGMVDEVASRFGHVDILVNNAGVVQTKPMLDLTEEDWDRVINVNLRGTFFCLQAVARRMIDQAPDDLKKSQVPTDVFSMDAGEPEQTPRSVGKLREDRQSGLDLGPAGTAAVDPLRRQQGRHHQRHPVGGPGPGALQHKRQRRCSGGRADAHVGSHRPGPRRPLRRPAGGGHGRLHPHHSPATRFQSTRPSPPPSPFCVRPRPTTSPARP